ncbi:hypothetical protein RHSIM_Rhsim02G0250400 [Rhododendron simsii]|uniref:Uncharacterized protein n=1 Tax=Rhododendron simsii TaxID=118357 RepID=A0A834LRK6_RHOSS|nr:hypothetical protein RHSIM_Rhsim02G0250400 [Rhododendron simsii]
MSSPSVDSELTSSSRVSHINKNSFDLRTSLGEQLWCMEQKMNQIQEKLCTCDGLAMAVTFFNVNSQSGLKKLDDYLLTRSYITGYQASKDDITVHAAISKPPSSEYVNVSRWYNHIEALLRISGVSAEGCGVTIEGSAPVFEEAVATTPAADSMASCTSLPVATLFLALFFFLLC